LRSNDKTDSIFHATNARASQYECSIEQPIMVASASACVACVFRLRNARIARNARNASFPTVKKLKIFQQLTKLPSAMQCFPFFDHSVNDAIYSGPMVTVMGVASSDNVISSHLHYIMQN